MRAALGLALAVSIMSPANAATVDPVDVWRPVHWIIGTWKGSMAGANGPVKVKRSFASASTNQHLEISELNGGRSRSMWGIVSVDPERHLLVMRHFAADGSVSEFAFDPTASADGKLVFASPESGGTRTHITFERTGSTTFVERIERTSGGDAFALVSETRFERTDR